MRVLKMVGIGVGILAALLVAVLLGAWLFIHPNDFRDRIERSVKKSTGRELDLSGDIKLSLFPSIALELGPARLGNAQGFGAKPFAAVEHAALRVKLLPLLHGQVQIGRVEIVGLDLRLEKNSQGKGNWEDLNSKDSAAPEAPPSGTETPLDLAGLEIKDSRVSYQAMVLDHLSVDVGHFGAGTPVPVEMKFDLTTGAGAQPIKFASKFVVKPDTAHKQYRFAALAMDGSLGAAPGAAAVSWKFSAPELSLDLGAQTMSAPAFSAQLAAAHLSGSLRGSAIIDKPSFSGAFKLDPVALRELLSQLGDAPSATRDPKALTKLAAKGNFAYGGNAASATHLDVQLDDSELKGEVAITNLDTKALHFALALDHIDIDRYLSPDKPQAQAHEEAKPFEVPGKAVKALQMNGSLTIASAKVAGVNLSQVRVGIDAKDGVTRINPASAKLYGGDYSGDITLDARAAIPAMKLDQSMTGIDVAQLLKDFAKSQHISGRGNVTTSLTAHGSRSDALMQSLSGHVTTNLANGAVEGVDLWFEINRAVALLQKQPLPAGSSSGRTKFDTFKASADLTNGVATNNDLNVASQNLRVTGRGTVNLVSDAIDYQVRATILKQAPTANAAAAKPLAEIPVNITGTMANPKIRPDLEGIAKARVQQEVDKHKDELQKKLNDKLKNIFK